MENLKSLYGNEYTEQNKYKEKGYYWVEYRCYARTARSGDVKLKNIS